MILKSAQILFFLEVVLFASVIFMHLARTSSYAISLYIVQSSVIAVLLFGSAIREFSVPYMLVALLVLIVKVIVAPYFFQKLTKKHHLKFSASTYLNGPLTLIVLAALTAFTYSDFFRPLTILARQNEKALLLAVAMIMISVFLIINRRGVLSQMIGILSLENAIVSFAFLAGLEADPGLQLGIIFDILVWVIIATVFASMIYRQFGTLDVTSMAHLKED